MTNVGPPTRTPFPDGFEGQVVINGKTYQLQIAKGQPSLPWIKWFQSLPMTLAAAEVPTGAINGINRIYTLDKSPNPPAAVLLFLSGHLQRQGVGLEYTLAGPIITMAVAPPIGSWLLAWSLN
jgi:hypothetical protein